MHRRGGVHCARDALQLRQHRLRGCRVGQEDVEGADALRVQPHVLGVALRHEHLEAAGGEEAHRGGVHLEVAAGEPLVRDVEKGHQAAGRAHVRDRPPLRRARVDARGVVRAPVEDHNRAGGRGTQVRNHACAATDMRVSHAVTQRAGRPQRRHTLEVQPRGGGVEVAVRFPLNFFVAENVFVVAPRRVRDVRRAAGHELGDEGGAQAQRPRALGVGTRASVAAARRRAAPHAQTAPGWWPRDPF